MKVRWLSSALDGLVRLHTHISTDNPRAAHRVTARIRRTTQQLKQYPNSGRPGNVSGSRELVVTGLPIVIVYRITAEAVEIIRVFHTSTNWKTVATDDDLDGLSEEKMR